jgi:hypothetical protein
MGDTNESENPFADRTVLLGVVSTVLLAAKIISVRGQPINNGDINEAVSNAATLLGEVERRGG